ncbi:MAG: hypothetical protein GF308_01935 [Candidatus Heimdallarchaeota archaeon]|nr:hypothetical protein [Candidatus Heimdallarchaeota archaeon]
MDNPRLVKIYKQARKDFEEFVGETPEDYRVLVFIDPELHGSLYQVMELGGSPHAILSKELINNLREARNQNFLPDQCISVFPSKPTMIYLSVPFQLEESPEQDFALRVMLIHAFAHAYFAEKSASNDSKILTEIYKMDMIIKELIMNNAYGLKESQDIAWGLPYFQDMVAVIRLLSTFGIQEFYIPPETSRDASLFQNFLLEIIGYLKKRADMVKKKNLTGVLSEAFANYIHNKIAEKILENAEYPFTSPPRLLKPIYGPPMNNFSYDLVEKAFRDQVEQPREIIKELLTIKNDLELLKKVGGRGDVRDLIKELRESTQATNVYWHADSSGYWRKTWNIYESRWDQIDDYVKFLYRYQCVNVGEWLQGSDAFQFYGHVKVNSKPVYVFEIDDESIALEQLLILHNHSQLYRKDFSMPVPGFPDLIMFKKLDRMVVGTLLSVGQLQENPYSPWDIPTFTRAIDISRELLDYITAKQVEEEQEEEVAFEAASSDRSIRKDIDYSNLKKMSQSKLDSVKVLIEEIVRNQV